jgi:hypothetical protein
MSITNLALQKKVQKSYRPLNLALEIIAINYGYMNIGCQSTDHRYRQTHK